MRESNITPGELEELGERLKVEFGIDRQILTPTIEERLRKLALAERAKPAAISAAPQKERIPKPLR
jgi:hypothetical protein